MKADDADWKPSVNPWLIALAVMLATFLEVLDTSVANVALPNMAGSMASSLDEATWVLTSYLVANAIVLPMTGWLSGFFGRKRFLMVSTALFTLASAACGMADSMSFLISAGISSGGRRRRADSALAGHFDGKFSAEPPAWQWPSMDWASSWPRSSGRCWAAG